MQANVTNVTGSHESETELISHTRDSPENLGAEEEDGPRISRPPHQVSRETHRPRIHVTRPVPISEEEHIPQENPVSHDFPPAQDLRMQGRPVGEFPALQQDLPVSWQPTVLVLGPGGAKGFLELGALLVLEREHILEGIQHYVGVSVGAVIALLLVAGYTVTEIISEAIDTNLFHDISCINLSEAKANSGLISNRPVKDKLVSRLEAKFGFVPTLSRLYTATGLKLTCVTMNLDKDRAEYISKETDPSLSCVDAVMLSMNIPLLFYKIKHMREGKHCVYIDGAFGNPYPVDQYDDGETDILGISIVGSRSINSVSVDSSVLLYLYKIIDSSMVHTRRKIKEMSSSRCRHLELLTPTLDTTGLTLDMRAKSAMVLQGYRTAEKFLNLPDGDNESDESDNSGDSESDSINIAE